MPASISDIEVKHRPVLDPGFCPAVLWTRRYREDCRASRGKATPFRIALERPDGSRTDWGTEILPWDDESTRARTLRHLERALKFLLWQRGGCRIHLGGQRDAAGVIEKIYAPGGARAFDFEFMGEKIYGQPFGFVVHDDAADVPEARESVMPLGRHLDGCRIGFDLGGSDRKCAAVIDGEPVFTEEVEWDPYFHPDPAYHRAGIQQSLERAAAHLPRVDAIGGSAAGIYVNNEVRAASLFRGVAPEIFESRVRRLFFEVQDAWGGVPFVVVNDGEVTALAGSMSLGANAILGIAMGTSEAVGYVTPEGSITSRLNELAFAPIDYRENAPVDEWSGDGGCGAQYFSQQGVARLAPVAGFDFGDDVPFPERLIAVQEAMKAGDENAFKIYDTIGACFGYAVAHYAEFYEIENLMTLGRVTSGAGGERLLDEAKRVLADEFPGLHERLTFCTASEKDKRHGQAVAAASLPALG